MTDSYSPIPASITTPDNFETSLGPIQFRDGYAIPKTATNVADGLDFLHGVEAFMNSTQGVSLWALRKGFADALTNRVKLGKIQNGTIKKKHSRV